MQHSTFAKSHIDFFVLQHQSDAQSSSHTPIGVGQQGFGGCSTLPRPPMSTNHSIYSTTSRIPSSYNTVQAQAKSLSDYENEILMLRSEMEQLQLKLGDAESRLHAKEQQNRTSVVFRAENDAKQIVDRLVNEEDSLRRGPLDPQNLGSGEKEKMIQMQQQKIATLDEANCRLIEELNRLGEQLNLKQKGGGASVVLKPKSSVSSFGGPASTLVSVTTTPLDQATEALRSVGGATASGTGGSTTVTSINMTSNSLSTSPHPSSSSSCSAPRRFGSPSSTISSSSSVSSASALGQHQSNIPVKSPNRSITVISNGQTAFIPPNASSNSIQGGNGKTTTTLTLPIGVSSSPTNLSQGNNNVTTCTSSANVAMQSVQETPKTVDELLDSLHSTPI